MALASTNGGARHMDMRGRVEVSEAESVRPGDAASDGSQLNLEP